MSRLNRLFDTHPPLEERIQRAARSSEPCTVPSPASPPSSPSRWLVVARLRRWQEEGRRAATTADAVARPRPPCPPTVPAHRAARTDARRGHTLRAGGEDRERAGGPPAGGLEPGRRGLRGERRGRRHPLPRHLPLHRLRPGRPGALAATDRPRRRAAVRRAVRLLGRHATKFIDQLHARHRSTDVGYDNGAATTYKRGRQPRRAAQPLLVDRQALDRGPADPEPPPPALFDYLPWARRSRGRRAPAVRSSVPRQHGAATTTTTQPRPVWKRRTRRHAATSSTAARRSRRRT